MKMLQIFLLAVIVSAFGEPRNRLSDIIEDGRIVGGERAKLGEFPHQISLRYNGGHTCGGSIVHAYYILTAAHCVYGRNNPKRFTVVTGTNQLSKGGDKHEVEWIKYPKRFSSRNLIHDVAILKLKKGITFNKYQKPIALTKSNTPKGLLGKFSGWGLRSYPNNTLPDELQKIDVFTYSNSVCQRLHNRYVYQRPKNIFPGMLCAFNMHSVGACKGDSGGPLILHDKSGPVLVGIVSFVWRYCALGVPDVYSRVHYYLNWINKQTNYSIFSNDDYDYDYDS